MRYTILTDNINLYFKEIRKNVFLTKKQEVALFKRISKGDQSARTEVFNSLAKLAVFIAKTYTNDPDMLQDLIQEANCGILLAIDKYDPQRGHRFSSYARWWMKAQIMNFINEKDAVHPANMQLTYKARKIREQFFKENHREITEYELMDALEEMGEIVTDLSAIVNVVMERVDLPNEDGVSMLDAGEVAMSTSHSNDFIEQEEEEGLSEVIAARLRRLTPREQTLIKMKFGIGYDYEMDYKTIAEKYNEGKPKEEQLCQERIRQICTQALQKMRQ